MVFNPLSIYLLVFMFGACIGSFLNVVIFRLPAGQSVVKPGSRCPNCRKAIPLYLNIPILSWILLGARCRFCSAPISIRYPVVELLTGLIFLIIFSEFGLTPASAFWMVFASVLIAVSFIDLDHQIIPDIISIPGIFIFSTSALVLPDMTVVKTALGILAGGGTLYAVAYGYYLLKGVSGMGGGDIKLLAMIGAATGAQGVLFTLFTASVLGTAAGIVSMAVIQSRDFKLKIPFGPFLSLGALIYILWGNQLIFWYFNLLGQG